MSSSPRIATGREDDARGHCWIVGSGALATEVACSLAICGADGTRVTILARSEAGVDAVQYLATTRADAAGRAVSFAGLSTDLDDAEALAAALRADAPALVLCAVSLQSPWEHRDRPSQWSSLVRHCGLGLTLPLQVAISATVARAIELSGVSARLLNAPFPDAANAVMAELGLPVFAGVGNVAIVASSLRSELRLGDRERLRVLAAHRHLSEPEDARDEALAWVDGYPVTDVTARLRRQRRCPRDRVNLVTGFVTADLIRRLLAGEKIETNLPGPAGLTGGYPVRLNGCSSIELDLPGELSLADAREWNQRAAVADGAVVQGDGTVSHTDRVAAALQANGIGWADGWAVTDLAEVTQELLALRAELRALPAGDLGQGTRRLRAEAGAVR